MQMKLMMPVLLAALGAASAGAAAQTGQLRYVPSNTVVKARLEKDLSTKTARRGDTFSARLANKDFSGLPEGTRFQGVVTEVEQPDKKHPGVLNVKLVKAVLPNGTTVPMAGTLASLEDKDVTRASDGRLESRGSRKGGKFEPKWVGYGAAGGAVLSTIFGGGLLKGALLGAAGGAAYSYLNKGKGKSRNSHVELPAGTRFGIRLNNQLAFRENSSFHYASYDRDRDSRDEDRDDRDRDRRDRDRDRDRDDRDRSDRDRDR